MKKIWTIPNDERYQNIRNLVSYALKYAGCYAGDDDVCNIPYPPSLKRLKKLYRIVRFLDSGNNPESIRRFIEWLCVTEPCYGAYKCPALLAAYREEYARRTPLLFKKEVYSEEYTCNIARLWGYSPIDKTDTAYTVSVQCTGNLPYRKEVQKF